MTPLLLGGVFKVAEGLIGLADQAIEDKDKRLEFQTRVMERTFSFYETILKTPTTPKMDAFIKLLLVAKGFLRPIGAFLLTAGAAWMAAKGIMLPAWLEAAMAAAFPGWILSRHAEKKEKRSKDSSDWWD